MGVYFSSLHTQGGKSSVQNQKCNSYFSSCLQLLQLLLMVLLILVDITLVMLIMMVLIVMTRRITSATRNPSNKNMKNAMLTSVSMLSSHIVQKSMNRSTTTLTLLKESLKLLMLIMNPMLVITTSVPLILVTMGTLAVLTVRTRRRSSATSTPRKTLARSPSRLARKLWTPSILKSVRRESTPIVRNHMRGVTTALVLLIIIPRLSLLLITQDIMRAMEVITRKMFSKSC